MQSDIAIQYPTGEEKGKRNGGIRRPNSSDSGFTSDDSTHRIIPLNNAISAAHFLGHEIITKYRQLSSTFHGKGQIAKLPTAFHLDPVHISAMRCCARAASYRSHSAKRVRKTLLSYSIPPATKGLRSLQIIRTNHESI